MTEWAILAAKAATPLASRLAAAGWRRWTMSWLVARDTTREAKKAGVEGPPFFVLRRFLSAGIPEQAFRSGDPEQFRALLLKIQGLGDANQQDLDETSAKQLFAMILSSYTRRAGLRQAIEAQARSSTAELAAQIREAREEESESALVAALRKMPPVRADQVRQMAAESSVLRRLVKEFAAATDKKGAIEDWHAVRPSWLRDMPTNVQLFVADLAADYGVVTAAADLIDEALLAGATPASYWRLRRDLIRAGDGDAEVQRAVLEAHAAEHPWRQRCSLASTERRILGSSILRSGSTRIPERRHCG